MHCGADFEVPGEGRRTVDQTATAEERLARLVRSFDRNDGTRQVLSIRHDSRPDRPRRRRCAPGGVSLALVGAVGVYFRLCRSARRIVVHGAYGTAALIGCLHLVATDLDPANLPGARRRTGAPGRRAARRRRVVDRPASPSVAEEAGWIVSKLPYRPAATGPLLRGVLREQNANTKTTTPTRRCTSPARRRSARTSSRRWPSRCSATAWIG